MATISLNRPALHHAINLQMIRELGETLIDLNSKSEIRIILLRSEGENFCAGADLNWLKEGMNQSEDQLVQEALELAKLFALMRSISPIIVTAVQGKVMGGANGLVAASDLVIGSDSARFSFSEVKLGLIPATIAPFVVSRVGKSKAAGWMISGRLFDTEEALRAGLIDIICEDGQLETKSKSLIGDLLSGGPEAMAGIKKMIHSFDFGAKNEEVSQKSAEILANSRKSPEGQEGMKAFLEKRRPSWNGK